MKDSTRYDNIAELQQIGIYEVADCRRSYLDQRLIHALRRSPGMTAAELATQLRVGRSTATRGLRHLEDYHQVTRDCGGFTRTGARAPDHWALTRRPQVSVVPRVPLTEVVLEWLTEHPGRHTVTAIAHGTGRSGGAVTKALARLVGSKLVTGGRKRPRTYAIGV